MKKTPKALLMELAGGSPSEEKWTENVGSYKQKIVDQIAPYLTPLNEESDSEMKERLLNGLSNKKLLKLHKVTSRLKEEFSGKKENLVNALLDLRKGKSGKVDQGYKTHLEKKSVANLMLWFDHSK